LGVISGGGDRTVLLAAGFAAAITESISMGAVGFTSTTADRDFFKANAPSRKRLFVTIQTLSTAK
jgi:hypothetical protein